MVNFWSRAQFGHRFIVLSSTLLTVRDVTQPPAAVTQLSIGIALGVTEIDILMKLVGLQNCYRKGQFFEIS